MSTRIYKVTALHGSDLVPISFLVSAISPGKAQKYVARKFINAKLATPQDVAEQKPEQKPGQSTIALDEQSLESDPMFAEVAP